MYTAEYVLAVSDVPLDQRYMVLAVQYVYVSHRTELSVLCWQLCVCHTLGQPVVYLAVFFQL